MQTGYTPLELARAAGFIVRRVPTGGVSAREFAFGRVLELGPDATDDEIERHACRNLALPAATRPKRKLAPAI